MAKNWSASEAVAVIREGKDFAAIQDIGRRFPIFVVLAASGAEGLTKIVQATPTHLTARKIESQLKAEAEGEVEEEVEDDTEEEEEAPKETPKQKALRLKKEKAAAKKEEEDDEEDDEEEEESETPKQKALRLKKEKAAAKKVEDEDEDEDEDDGYDDMSLPQLKKEAKKQKVDIKGLKTAEDIITALRGEESEDEDEDEDWDL